MKSNGLLKWLLIPIVLLAVFLGIRWVSSDRHPSGAQSGDTDRSHLTAEEMKALGVEGDTPRDTVATLVAQVKQLRNELQTTLGDNKAQKTENERLRSREAAVDQRIQTAIGAERDRWREEREQASGEQQQTQSLLEDLKRRLDNVSDKGGHADLPVGIGLEDGDADSFNENRLRWVEPQGAHPADAKGSSSRRAPAENGVGPPTGFGPAPDRESESVERATDTRTDGDRKRSDPLPAKPVYTVPANATLIGSTAMTALIGRVPIDGTVNDPYPFKVLIGAENLTANGIDIPDVAGAVISGTASGDWTLSCVRGQIRSVTFVFQDGTIRTMTESSSASAAAGDGLRTGLGWISDPYGIPCVSGARRSNAQQYLSSQMLITAAGAGAASLIDSNSANVSYINGSNGNSLGTVGITGHEAMGRILAGGVQEMSQWVNKLYGQAFAAVYVPPGAKVAVHLEQPLEIDYEPQGRKVNHREGGAHVPDFD